MSEQKLGELAWIDLSVKDATKNKDFYQKVIGWGVEEVSMGDYNDYSMTLPGSNDAVTGICHATGVNADLPAAWLPYFLVENIEESVSFVVSEGGELLTEIKAAGNDKYVVIKDPAGAMCALYQKG
ncbi:VOC family protein [Colwelliaceae bacterium 6471]